MHFTKNFNWVASHICHIGSDVDNRVMSKVGKLARGLITMTIMGASLLSTGAQGAAAAGNAYVPANPVRIMVGFPPGGGADVIARILADTLTKQWNSSVVVENRPGAAGVVASKQLAKSATDGTVMGIISATQTVSATILPPDPTFDLVRDTTGIVRVANGAYVVVVGESPKMASVKNIANLISAGRSNPKGLSFGSGGTGTLSHLAGEIFNSAANFQAVHVPYKGSAADADLVAGRIDYLFANVQEVIGLIRSNRLRPIAVSSQTRHPLLPDVPPIADTLKGFEVSQWFGLVGPPGMSASVVRALNADIAKAALNAEAKPRFDDMGITPTSSNPEDFAALIKSEQERWGKIVKSLGLEGSGQ